MKRKMKVKNLVQTGLAVALAFSLAGCGGAATSSPAKGNAANGGAATASMAESGQTAGMAGVLKPNSDPVNTEKTDKNLTIGLVSEPSTLWASGTGKVENEEEMIAAAIRDCLVRLDRKTGEVVPDLATSWKWTDGTHCQFTLREDALMTDGTPLVADDVVYSVNVWKDKSANTDTGRFLVGATADDEHTVTIEFNTAAPDMLYLLAWSNFGIVSEDEVNAAGGVEEAAKKPVMGCGRYLFKEWNHGQNIVLERNDKYWDQDYVGYYKTVTLTFTNDSAARELAVEAGDAQVAFDLPLSQAATYAASENVSIEMYPFGQNTRLWYNMGKKAGATKDIRVRQAIDKALDFDAIAQVGTAGSGKSVLGYFPEDSKYYNATFTPEERKVDVEGAKALLKEAGYENGLSLKLIGMQDEEPVYTVMQENLRAAGINLSIDILDTPAFVEGANSGDYDLIHVGDLVDARYPAIMPFFMQQNIDTFNIGGSKYTTPDIENGVKQFISETDDAKAKKELANLEQTWKDEMYFSNTYSMMKSAAIAKNLKGYSTIERGFVDLTAMYEAS